MVLVGAECWKRFQFSPWLLSLLTDNAPNSTIYQTVNDMGALPLSAALPPAIRSHSATSYSPAASRRPDHTRHERRRPDARARPRLRGDPGTRRPHAAREHPLLRAAARAGFGAADPAA